MYFFSEVRNKVRAVIQYLTGATNQIDPSIQNVDENAVGYANIDYPDSTKVPQTPVSTTTILVHLKDQLTHPDNRMRVLASLGFSGTHVALNIIAPFLFAHTLEFIQGEEEETNFAGIEFNRQGIIVTLAAVLALMRLVPNVRDQILAPVEARNVQNAVTKSVKDVMNSPYHYHQQSTSEDKMRTIHQSVKFGKTGTDIVSKIAPNLSEIISASAFLSKLYGYEVGVVLIALMLSSTALSALTANKQANVQASAEDHEAVHWNTIQDILNKYSLASHLGRKGAEIEKLAQFAKQWLKTNVGAKTLPLQIETGHVTLANLAMLAIVLYTGLNVRDGKYTSQDFIVLTTYMRQLTVDLPAFWKAVDQFFVNYPELKSLVEHWVNHEQAADPFPDTHLALTNGQPCSIEFRNVSFTYPAKPEQPQNPPTLDDLSFTIRPGQILALVGKSGAGKSTIFNLLNRYYKPSAGTILINGQDIANLSLQSVQSAIALFGQDPNLFAGTLRDNIRYADPTSTDEKIIALAKEAHLESLLQNLSLDTELENNGKNLTLAQQRAVSIIRSMLKPSAIRFLDEVTSGLDSETAEQALQGVLDTSQGQCTILTSANPVTIPNAHILVLDKGKVCDQGNHEDLSKNSPIYKMLANKSKASSHSIFSQNIAAQQQTHDHQYQQQFQNN